MFKMLKIEDGINLPEIMIYFYINSLGDFLYMQKRLKGRGEIAFDVGLEDEDNAYADQKKLVEILKSREGFKFNDHEEYMQWFSWWSNWHKRELPDNEWRILSIMIGICKTEEDFKTWRPSGDWRKS